MDTISLLKAVEEHVIKLFHTNEKPYLLYHNLSHTQRVVKHAREIGEYYLFDQQSLFTLFTAAWFHDTGHLLGKMADHEELGVRLMRVFLSDRVEDTVVDDIADCIMATQMPVHPLSLTQQILCDADTYHLGTPEFRTTDPLVWQELELRTRKIFENKEERSLHFLENHAYYTTFCQELLAEGKAENIAWLKTKIASLQ